MELQFIVPITGGNCELYRVHSPSRCRTRLIAAITELKFITPRIDKGSKMAINKAGSVFGLADKEQHWSTSPLYVYYAIDIYAIDV